MALKKKKPLVFTNGLYKSYNSEIGNPNSDIKLRLLCKLCVDGQLNIFANYN